MLSYIGYPSLQAMQLCLWMCTVLAYPAPLPMKGFFRVNETTQTKQITNPIRWGGMPVGLRALVHSEGVEPGQP